MAIKRDLAIKCKLHCRRPSATFKIFLFIFTKFSEFEYIFLDFTAKFSKPPKISCAIYSLEVSRLWLNNTRDEFRRLLLPNNSTTTCLFMNN